MTKPEGQNWPRVKKPKLTQVDSFMIMMLDMIALKFRRLPKISIFLSITQQLNNFR